MPKVGIGENAIEFDYTPEGMAEAEEYAKATGLPISNAMESSEKYYDEGKV